MSDFTVHTPESAPQAAKDTLNSLEKSLGMVPNLAWVYGRSSGVAERLLYLK